MGLSNKKTTTTQNTTQNEDVTTTKTNPQWVTDSLQGFTGDVNNLLTKDPTSYVADANPLQTQAGAAAAGLGGYQGGLTQAGQLAAQGGAATTPQVQGASLLDNLQSYMNPFTNDVVNTSLADSDANDARTRAAQAAAGAKNSAFGGSRFGVQEATTEGELARARSTLDSGLRSDAFNTGAGLSNEDAARREQADLANQAAAAADADRKISAGGLMGNLAEASGNGARADVGTQMDAGTALRGIDTEKAQAPIGLLDAVGQLLGQGQFGLMNGATTNGTTTGTLNQTQNSSPSLMSSIGQAIQTAAAAAALSDERLKTDVETLGHDDRGRRWVTWRYLWEAPDAPRHTGVMAQEIAQTDPDAVLDGPMGFLMVDYSKLEGSPWLHS